MRAVPLVHRTLRVPLLVVGVSLSFVASLPAQSGERFTLEGDDVASPGRWWWGLAPARSPSS